MNINTIIPRKVTVIMLRYNFDVSIMNYLLSNTLNKKYYDFIFSNVATLDCMQPLVF